MTIVSVEAEVPPEGVEPFASQVFGANVSAGLEWPGVRQYIWGTEAQVQAVARQMAEAWLAVAAASEDRVAESEARAIRYRESAGRIRAERQAAADDRIMARDIAAEKAS